MTSRTKLAKELTSFRRLAVRDHKFKDKRGSNIIRVISIDQFNREAAIRYSKAMDEYQYKVRQEVPCRAMYFLYDAHHEERSTGYVLSYGDRGHKWFARKRDADAALLAKVAASK